MLHRAREERDLQGTLTRIAHMLDVLQGRIPQQREAQAGAQVGAWDDVHARHDSKVVGLAVPQVELYSSVLLLGLQRKEGFSTRRAADRPCSLQLLCCLRGMRGVCTTALRHYRLSCFDPVEHT